MGRRADEVVWDEYMAGLSNWEEVNSITDGGDKRLKKDMPDNPDGTFGRQTAASSQGYGLTTSAHGHGSVFPRSSLNKASVGSA